MSLPVLSAGQVTIRHISQGTGTGAVTVLGASFVAQPRAGLKGRRGYGMGRCERVVNDEGTATLTLPNTAGDDGVLHRRRFAIFTAADYHTGDEWLEIEYDNGLLFVGTPADCDRSHSTLTLSLVDGLWMQNTQRETAAGFWNHAPRDVFEHYTKAWVPVIADDFDSGADPAKWEPSDYIDQVGSVRLAPSTAPGSVGLSPDATYWPGVIVESERRWRLEMTYDRSLTGLGTVSLEMQKPGITQEYISLRVGTTSVVANMQDAAGSLDSSSVSRPIDAVKAGASLAIECHDRWVFFYVDGALVFSIEHDMATPGAVYRPLVTVTNGATPGSYADVLSLLLRRADPYLMRGADKGDYRLPGLLPAGGLIGTYYDEADLRSVATNAEISRRSLAPTRAPYARRQDAQVNFPTVAVPTWQPAGPPNGEYFGVRWTGAIYLDLAAADVTLRLKDVDGRGRLWVAKTMYGEQVANHWGAGSGVLATVTSGSMRTHLGGSVAGWYPIRVDYANGSGQGGITLEQSIGGGAYAPVPSSALSPLGIYEAQVRYDSHAEQLKAVATAYGLQYVCEARSLESGEFPGSVVPRLRVGRDTDKILTPAESTEASVKGDASEVIDTLYADAAGLGDQENAAQLTAESINFAALTSGSHMMIQSAYESLADITDPILLQTRLASMLGLRITTWQEVAARPRGHRELRGSFPIPLTPDLAMFRWEPGDGIRVQDDALDIMDLTPRQMMAVGWPFVPDGLGAPSVRFRQRPRAQQDALRTLVRSALLPQRNYQGQLAVVNGTVSLTDSGYSRVVLPRDLEAVTRCELVVIAKGDASTWTIQDYPAVAAIGTFNTTGRYDLLPYLRSYDGTSPQMIVNAVGGTSNAAFQLEIVVRI